jgi:hypothetical protein
MAWWAGGFFASGEPDVPEGVLFYACLFTVGALRALGEWKKEWRRAREMARLASALGLAYHERVHAAALEPFAELPLFAFLRDSTVRAAQSLEGIFQGRRVLLLECEYVHRGPGRARQPFRESQTLVILPGVEALPDFCASPEDDEWDAMFPGWTEGAGAGALALRWDEFSHEPTVIRGQDPEAVRCLFSPRRLRALGPLAGRCLECKHGHLLLYSPGVVAPPKRVPRLLERALELAGALTAPEEELPAGPGRWVASLRPAYLRPSPHKPEGLQEGPTGPP